MQKHANTAVSLIDAWPSTIYADNSYHMLCIHAIFTVIVVPTGCNWATNEMPFVQRRYIYILFISRFVMQIMFGTAKRFDLKKSYSVLQRCFRVIGWCELRFYQSYAQSKFFRLYSHLNAIIKGIGKRCGIVFHQAQIGIKHKKKMKYINLNKIKKRYKGNQKLLTQMYAKTTKIRQYMIIVFKSSSITKLHLEI